MEITWHPDALEDYNASNAKTKDRIIRLIEEIIEMGPLTGAGKPEALKWELEGSYSRRINKKDRLLYRIQNDNLYILACRHHYYDR